VHYAGRVDMTNRSGDKHPRAQAVVRVSPNGVRTVFSTITAACDATPRARRHNVWRAFVGQLRTHAGYKWEKV
jgi:hypothetical protein